ncbi:DUF7504 family protein [Halobacterium zhouii]|uniref:DUF7504 family protein n=1 Tax=Halobacterium zhouii TaxID=2902624 RepID=UPI001E4550BD|nr:hypothetical protein [Halobacterium zhouii]
MSDSTSELVDDLEDATNILVMERHSDEASHDVHETLLSTMTEGRNDVLVVTFSSPDSWLNAWAEHVSHDDSNLGLIWLTETEGREGTHGQAQVRSVDPRDLTGVGMAIQDFFDAVPSNSTAATVCFDSLTEILAYTSVSTLFRFVRVLTQQMNKADAVAHYHIDPVAHDQQSLARLTPPFDARIECGEDTPVSVTTRY